MNKILKKHSIAKKVISKVKSGQVKMKSKTYFILKTILFSLITLFTALFVVFFISFIIFNLKISGVWFLPIFGFKVIGIFLISLPWFLILTAIALIIVLEMFVKKFSFAYRRPILYSVLAIIAFVILGSFVITRTQIHSDFFWRAQEGKLPIAGKFYRGFGTPKLSNAHKGIVFDVKDNSFYLKTFNGEILTVIIDSNTKFPLSKSINKNDKIMILGKRNNDTIYAVDISWIEQFNKSIYWNKIMK